MSLIPGCKGNDERFMQCKSSIAEIIMAFRQALYAKPVRNFSIMR